MYIVHCMEDGTDYEFDAASGFEALEKMRYTLDLVHRDTECEVRLCNGRTLAMVHNGKTYACFI